MRTHAVLSMTTLSTLLVGVALAAGSSSVKTEPAAPKDDPKQIATQSYNSAVGLREKAAGLEQDLAGITDAKQRAKAEKQLAGTYKDAIKLLRSATSKDPELYQAHSELGYALRKTGKHTEALVAYDRALAIQPGYVPAIEYRGEAYLALNRVEDAQRAFDELLERDAAQAARLLDSMKRWTLDHKSKPGAASPAAVEQMERWIKEREAQAAQTLEDAAASAGTKKSDW